MTLATTLSLVLSLTPQDAAQEPAHPIAWQRSLADALAIQQATDLPLLIAVNMNGEVFNDRFRTQTYRSTAFVESTRGYVCVVASPDRHNERDYDSLGNRIECPAFPGCTCGEHIAIEPELFTRYFQGNRNAPRHVAVSKEGEILFDRFLDRSMQVAIDAIAIHRGTPVERPVPDTFAGLLQRRDAASRRAIEVSYRNAAVAQRLELMAAAARAKNDPLDLLRLALHSEEPCEYRAGAKALAAVATPLALADVEATIARDAATRNTMLRCLERLATTDDPAARLLAHLTTKAEAFGGPWQNDWQEPAYEIWQRGSVEAELDACEKLLRESPDDHTIRLRLAIAQLAFATALIAEGGKGVEFWLEDAKNSARRVPEGELYVEAQAVLANAAWLSNDATGARTAAAIALGSPADDREPNAWLATRLLETVVKSDTQSAYDKASDPKIVLQPEVARTHAALQQLMQSRWVSEDAVLTGVGLLEYAGLRSEARALLDTAVARFPLSPAVHERWRARTMIDLNAEAMRTAAGSLADSADNRADDRAAGEWFAGYAALVAAEQHVRDARGELTITAYTDSVDRFASSVAANPDYADSANHFAALALAGRALAQHEAGKNDAAVADLVAAAELRAATLDSEDGLKRTPRGIAKQVQKALEAAGKNELAARLADLAR